MVIEVSDEEVLVRSHAVAEPEDEQDATAVDAALADPENAGEPMPLSEVRDRLPIGPVYTVRRLRSAEKALRKLQAQPRVVRERSADLAW
ncbi:MAG: hypothetical protein ACR2NV_02830 [Thermoleophilaceae bacterium]